VGAKLRAMSKRREPFAKTTNPGSLECKNQRACHQKHNNNALYNLKLPRLSSKMKPEQAKYTGTAALVVQNDATAIKICISLEAFAENYGQQHQT
jgi:hypothetical protein